MGTRPWRTASVNLIGTCSSLADAANAPRQAASATAAAAATAATATATAAAASAAPAAAAASAAPAAAAALGNSFAERARAGVFLVEHVERAQTDVGDLFFGQRDLRPKGILGRRIGRRHGGRRGCSARQRQGDADDSYNRYSLLITLSLRSRPLLRHIEPPGFARKMFDEVDRTRTLIIRTLRAATWQGHYLPTGGYIGLTHALPCRRRRGEPQQNARRHSRFRFCEELRRRATMS